MVNMSLFSSIEANKLNNIQQNLDKSIEAFVASVKKHSDYDIYEFYTRLQEERHLQQISSQTKVSKIMDQVNSKKNLLKDELLDIKDFKQFKKEMISIQEDIQNLKTNTSIKIDLLNKQYEDISEDVDYYKEKMLEWSDAVKINAYGSAIVNRSQIGSKHKCKEMKDFIDFVHTSGGNENGWRKEDHQLFIKFRIKYKDAVAENLHEILPDISIDEIKRHEEWYNKYLTLKKKKKNAIKGWQKTKTNKNCQSIKIDSERPKIFHHFESHAELREKIMKWKVEKESNMQNGKEIELFKKQRQKELEELRKKKNDELRKIVNEWKLSKTVIEQEIQQKRIVEERERKRRAIEANRMIKQFQSQDDLYLTKLKQQRTQTENKPSVRSKSSQLAKRDPDRLLKPTQQWINRVHDENIYSGHFPNVLPLRNLPKLGIPEWRRKLD